MHKQQGCSAWNLPLNNVTQCVKWGDASFCHGRWHWFRELEATRIQQYLKICRIYPFRSTQRICPRYNQPHSHSGPGGKTMICCSSHQWFVGYLISNSTMHNVIGWKDHLKGLKVFCGRISKIKLEETWRKVPEACPCQYETISPDFHMCEFVYLHSNSNEIWRTLSQ